MAVSTGNGNELDDTAAGAIQICLCSNGFVTDINPDFDRDARLILRPDDAWLAIIPRYSYFVKATRARSKFRNADGKKRLTVIQEGVFQVLDY